MWSGTKRSIPDTFVRDFDAIWTAAVNRADNQDGSGCCAKFKAQTFALVIQHLHTGANPLANVKTCGL